MTAQSINDALSLAAWELAESESAMRRAEKELAAARRRQKRSAQHLAELHEQIMGEIKKIEQRKA